MHSRLFLHQRYDLGCDAFTSICFLKHFYNINKVFCKITNRRGYATPKHKSKADEHAIASRDDYIGIAILAPHYLLCNGILVMDVFDVLL